MGMEKSEVVKRTLVDFLIGVGFGVGLDAIMPQDSDGTLANTARQSLILPVVRQFPPARYGTKKERVARGLAMYFGAALGQTAYSLL